MKHFVFGLVVLGFFSGCTVYKSSDRDDFSEHGKANAPPSSKPADEHELCVPRTALTPEEQATLVKTDHGTLVTFNDGSLHTVCPDPAAP